MNRFAVFVDAGYVFAQGSALLAGSKARREDILLDQVSFMANLNKLASNLTQLPLLRVYWYDATRGTPNQQQIEIGNAPSVKLRLGLLNSQGVQKGVDSLIIADLITLAQNGAISDAILLSGDEDLRVGVQMAQERGVRVHLVGIHPGRGTVSGLLIQEADTFHTLQESDVRSFLSVIERAKVVPAAEPGAQPVLDETSIRDVVSDVLGHMDRIRVAEALEALISTGSLPQPVDSQLLVLASRRLGRVLQGDEKRLLRKEAREQLRQKRS